MADDPAMVLAKRGDRLVGRFGMFAGRMRVGSDEHRISWGSDWWVEPASRARGIGGLLLMRAMALAPDLVGFGPSAEALPIYRAARFEVVDVPRYSLLLSSKAVLRTRLGSLAVLVAPVADLALRMRRRGPPPPWAELESIERFGEVVDVLDSRRRAPVEFPRGSDELNWALAHPWLSGEESRPHAFLLRGVEGPAGYALMRVRRTGGRTIATLLRGGFPSGAEASALLMRLRDAATGLGADVLELCTTDPELGAAAAAVGMLRRGRMQLVARLAGAGGRALAASGLSIAGARIQQGEGDVLFA